MGAGTLVVQVSAPAILLPEIVVPRWLALAVTAPAIELPVSVEPALLELSVTAPSIVFAAQPEPSPMRMNVLPPVAEIAPMTVVLPQNSNSRVLVLQRDGAVDRRADDGQASVRGNVDRACLHGTEQA